jgi:hypothetical protein
MLTVADIVAAAIAAAALVLGIVNYVEAREPRVLWSLEPDTTDEHGLAVRLVNSGRRFAAVVEHIEDPDEDGKPSALVQPTPLPVTIEPGNGFRFILWQYDGRPHARVTVTWRQRRANGRWVRPVRRKITLYK